MNCCVFSGYLLDKPELRSSSAGKSVLEMRMNIPRDYKTSEGKRESDFITVVAWGRLAEVISSTCEKGTRLNIITRVRTELYTDKNGVKRESHKYELDRFEFAGKKGSGASQNATENVGQEGKSVQSEVFADSRETPYTPHFENLGEDEELPF